MEQFEEAEKYLKGLGYSVINPAKVNGMLPTDTSYREYIVMSLNMLAMADEIYMLEGWEHSKRACAEYELARAFGMVIIKQNREAEHGEETS